MSPLSILIILFAYVLLLLVISFFTGKNKSNADFFSGSKRSPWYVVAFGMIGATISGVTFVSVPGWVRSIDFTYMQMVIGFFFGYLVVVYVLLPLYYKLNLTSIYGYLGIRFGRKAHRTGAWFFLLSKMVSASARMYIVVLVLQQFVFDALGVPFYVTTCGTILVIWLYTFRGGIKTIVWTDFLHTFFLILALILLIVESVRFLNTDCGDAIKMIYESGYSRMFVFDDWQSRQNFFKQFFSGIFVVIVMTGLDQDIMQKNLSCKNLKESRRNMLSYGFSFIPVNLLFLSLGALLLIYAGQNGIALPSLDDSILPMFAMKFGGIVTVCFVIGVIASAFSSADSALTSLTTSFSIDILRLDKKNDTSLRKSRFYIHLAISVIFALAILLFREINSKSAIDGIYTIVSYTYGPLLGLYTFGLFTRKRVNDRWIPFIAFSSPVLTFGIDRLLFYYCNYALGYEMLMLNGGLTFLGLWLARENRELEIENQE